MSDFKKEYELWDEFLNVWPLSRLTTMTLDEYTQAGSKDSFTYWIESRLDGSGSIWGGSSFKFGVYSRNDTENKSSDAKLSYSDTHGWYSSLSDTAEDAFTQVREYIVHVATLAADGDLDGIEAFEHLGEAYKWKIAFHYQNRAVPTIVGIFKKAPLAIFVSKTTSSSMAVLQKTAVAKRPADLGILEFGRQIWEVWSQKNLAIWKLSHGNPPIFTEAERQKYLDDQLALIHCDTGKGQGKKFKEAPVGSLFFLCHGNSPQRIGQFTTDAQPCDKGDGWLQRSYRVLKPALKKDRYTANSKYWSPQGNSTFYQVGEHDLPEFESTLLKPYFGTDLAELAKLVGESIEAASLNISSTDSPGLVPNANTKLRNLSMNSIYYGPPGTGKTYKLQQLLKDDYTDENNLPDKNIWLNEKLEGLSWYEIIILILLDSGGYKKVADITSHKFYEIKAKLNEHGKNLRATAWSALQRHTVHGSATVNYKSKVDPLVFNKTNDSLWYIEETQIDQLDDYKTLLSKLKFGPEKAEDIKRYAFVTFHQSYGYEEFIEGLRPVTNNDGDISYEVKPGVFKRICIRAELDPENQYAIVIDEINRGNISKIFGELITLVETDKRAGADNELTLTLPYSGTPFSVPSNLDIIGTMNTADRSLTHIDMALRRRFDFNELRTDYSLVNDDVDGVNVRHMLYAMNQRIELLLDREHILGHALLMNITSLDELAHTFKTNIMPLLEEYFFENWDKIKRVLSNNAFVEEHNGAYGTWLGEDDDYADKSYRINYNTLSDSAEYIKIYSSIDTSAFAECDKGTAEI